MAANFSSSSALDHLEKTIGFPRGTELTHSFIVNQRKNLESWLILRGLSQKSAQNAQVESIATAYKNDYYFQKWLSSDMKRTGKRKELSGIGWDAGDVISKDEGEIAAAEPEINTSDDISPQAASDAAVSLTKQQIAAAAQSVISSKLVELEARLIASLEDRVRNAKLVLSEAAKDEIRGLATQTTKDVLAKLLPQRIEVVQPSGNIVDMGLQHMHFPKLLKAMQARNHRGNRLNVWLTGPTGSGKTSACESAAIALGLAFDSDGSLDTDYKVLGFTDANGHVISTAFLRIYGDGGVYVADEIDNWLPGALVALNAALANGWVSTPAGIIKRHPDAIIVACANTWGLGATNDYVGRSKLDAASLDRFRPKIDWPYDERMEMAIARAAGGEEWCSMVQRVRHAARTQGLQIIISPRATYDGIGLLAAGFSWAETVEMAITAGLKPEQIKSLGTLNMRSSASYDDIAAD